MRSERSKAATGYGLEKFNDLSLRNFATSLWLSAAQRSVTQRDAEKQKAAKEEFFGITDK